VFSLIGIFIALQLNNIVEALEKLSGKVGQDEQLLISYPQNWINSITFLNKK
jgi:hypothetical protein